MEEDDEFCPVGKEDDVAPNLHCSCWYEGDGCCRCKTPAMTEDQMREQGMLD